MCIDILYCSLAIVCVSSWFQAGMIFSRIGDWFEGKFPKISKPMFMCLVCMAPWYGTIYWLTYKPELGWIQFVLAVGGLNALISLVYGYFTD